MKTIRGVFHRLLTPRGFNEPFRTAVEIRNLLLMAVTEFSLTYLIRALMIIIGLAVAILVASRFEMFICMIVMGAAYVLAGLTHEWVITAVRKSYPVAQIVTHFSCGLFVGMFIIVAHTLAGGLQRGDAALAIILVFCMWLHDMKPRRKSRTPSEGEQFLDDMVAETFGKQE